MAEEALALEWGDVGDEVRVAVAPATLALVVDVAADFTLAVGLDARERTLVGVVGETLAGGTLTAGRLDPVLVAAAGADATRSTVEVATAAALLVVEATVEVAVETAALVVVAAVETAFVVVVATVETAFVVGR